MFLGQRIGCVFVYCLSLEGGTDMLSQKIDKQLPIYFVASSEIKHNVGSLSFYLDTLSVCDVISSL